MKTPVASWLFAAILASFTLPAGAVPFSATPADVLGPLNGGSVLHNVVSPGAGPATLTFDLLGYNTVDGQNCCTDTFQLTINGNLLFSGGFNMGGGGAQFVNSIDPGVTIVSTASFGNGGLTQFSVNHALLSGNNTYLFDYGVMQGLNDEGWGLRSVAINGDVAVGVIPEPETYAMLLAGLGLLGFASRRKKLKAT